eukprot:SAG22_NODE_682_length_7924_cov_25.432460_6_plen_160_part_00
MVVLAGRLSRPAAGMAVSGALWASRLCWLCLVAWCRPFGRAMVPQCRPPGGGDGGRWDRPGGSGGRLGHDEPGEHDRRHRWAARRPHWPPAVPLRRILPAGLERLVTAADPDGTASSTLACHRRHRRPGSRDRDPGGPSGRYGGCHGGTCGSLCSLAGQ